MTGVEFADSALAAVDGADACVLVTEWPEFAELDWTEVARARWPATWSSTGATSSTARRCSPRGFSLRGDRPVALQALILAGGEGTRLRPLTSTMPKPVVPLVDRPFISYMLEWLRRHGVDDVILSCGFMADGVRAVLGDGVGARRARCATSRSREPLGTGGALKFAEDLLDERFFMLNGDVPHRHRPDRAAGASTSGPARARRWR